YINNLASHLRDHHPDLCHQARSNIIRHHKGLLSTLLEKGPREDQLAQHSPANPAKPIQGLPIHPGFTYIQPGYPGSSYAYTLTTYTAPKQPRGRPGRTSRPPYIYRPSLLVQRGQSATFAFAKIPSRNNNKLQQIVTILDQLFFNQYISRLKSIPLITRLLLTSPHPHNAHSRPFSTLQKKTSIDQYLIYVKRFLYYYFNILSLEENILFTIHSFHFTHTQQIRLKEL
ncbi:hypothetical protein LB507_004187, partial [Fusarium sp. FIESC RH6]